MPWLPFLSLPPPLPARVDAHPGTGFAECKTANRTASIARRFSMMAKLYHSESSSDSFSSSRLSMYSCISPIAASVICIMRKSIQTRTNKNAAIAAVAFSAQRSHDHPASQIPSRIKPSRMHHHITMRLAKSEQCVISFLMLIVRCSVYRTDNPTITATMGKWQSLSLSGLAVASAI